MKTVHVTGTSIRRLWSNGLPLWIPTVLLGASLWAFRAPLALAIYGPAARIDFESRRSHDPQIGRPLDELLRVGSKAGLPTYVLFVQPCTCNENYLRPLVELNRKSRRPVQVVVVLGVNEPTITRLLESRFGGDLILKVDDNHRMQLAMNAFFMPRGYMYSLEGTLAYVQPDFYEKPTKGFMEGLGAIEE